MGIPAVVDPIAIGPPRASCRLALSCAESVRRAREAHCGGNAIFSPLGGAPRCERCNEAATSTSQVCPLEHPMHALAPSVGAWSDPRTSKHNDLSVMAKHPPHARAISSCIKSRSSFS